MNKIFSRTTEAEVYYYDDGEQLQHQDINSFTGRFKYIVWGATLSNNDVLDTWNYSFKLYSDPEMQKELTYTPSTYLRDFFSSGQTVYVSGQLGFAEG